jgi:hypothetical protein
MSEDTVVGTAIGMHSWAALNGNPYLAIGSDQRLAILYSGTLYDITPLEDTTDGATFATNIGSATVNVTDASAPAEIAVGDWVNILTFVSVGDLVLQGFYQISAVPGGGGADYSIVAPTVAGSTASPGAVSLFTTVNLSPTVTVTLNDHGYTTGDYYTVHVRTVLNLVDLRGPYTVTVTGVNTFDVVGSPPANAGSSASENGILGARVQYLIASGLASAEVEAGYGSGTYGTGTYGTGSTTSTLVAPLRQWAMDNWGQDLNASYTGGPIYTWSPPVDVYPSPDIYSIIVAEQLANAPERNIDIFVMMPARILVAAGTEFAPAPGGDFDPLLVRWCDVEDNEDWTVLITNQAGSFRLPTGSKIIGAMRVAKQGLIWTDVDLWSMTYMGLPYVFGFNQVGANCGLIAQRAAATIGNQVVWMSQNNFFSYGSGGIQSIECSVWDVVFEDLDIEQADKIFAWTNSLFNEVTWFFPSGAGDGTVDTYVKLNMSTGTWDYGTLVRTAGDEGGVLGAPVAVDENHLIQQHERGNNADGESLDWSFETGFFDIEDGENFIYIDRLIPDFIATGGARIKFTIYARDYPEAGITQYGPYTYRYGAPYLSTRVRGRQFSIKFAGTDLDSFVRLGAVRYSFQPDGRR